MTNIYLDENLSEHVADALNNLSKGYFRDVEVYSTKNVFGRGAPDETIIPGIGKAKGIWITRDENAYRFEEQYKLCKKYKIGIFILKLAKGRQDHWSMVMLLIQHWHEIVEIIRSEKRPFGYQVLTNVGLNKLK
ncbi:MAG TPA: hypothetical protein VK666_11695 [Chryseolinea sp.]|nr:hypothetical protein [Chryseolinea sp.]